MNDTTPVKFGICGLGRFGHVHLRHFTANPSQFKVVALCDHDAARVKAPADEHGCTPYSDYAEFLDDSELELVIIATRSLDHTDNADQALKAGKTVLLEKPIGVTRSDYLALQQLTQNYPGKLFFCHNHRFEPAYQNTQAIIATGILGEVYQVKLCKHHAFMRRNDWQMRLDCGGGQLSVWGPHLIDQGLQLLSTPVRDVSSNLRRILTPGDGDDHVHISLVDEKGLIVDIEISNSAAIASPYCTIYGDRGSLSYDQQQQHITLRYLDPTYQWPELQSDAGHPSNVFADQKLPWLEETRDVTPCTNMWEQVEVEIVRHLYKALRQNIPFPITSDQALEVVRISQIVKDQNPQFAWIGQ